MRRRGKSWCGRGANAASPRRLDAGAAEVRRGARLSALVQSVEMGCQSYDRFDGLNMRTGREEQICSTLSHIWEPVMDSRWDVWIQ